MSRRRWWVALIATCVLVIGLDLITPPAIQFPITFVAPVGLAAWHLGRRAGLAFAFALVGARLAIALGLDARDPSWAPMVNAGIRLLILGAGSVLMDLVARQRAETRRRVAILEGILPICAGCKRIRQDDGAWQQIEVYVSEHSAARFSHGICPECTERLYGPWLKGESGSSGGDRT